MEAVSDWPVFFFVKTFANIRAYLLRQV